MLRILNISLLLLIIQLYASFSHSKFVIVIIAITMNTQIIKVVKTNPIGRRLLWYLVFSMLNILLKQV